MITEWKVEWIDEDGRGHVTEFEQESIARKYGNAVAPLSMMLDIYKRDVQEWQRNPSK